MIDPTAAYLALRTRARTITVASTSGVNLSATATGFTRASGSFITEGYYAGMEVAGTGFSSANNSVCVIEEVRASSLVIKGGRTPQSSTAGRTLTVGIPSKMPQENVVSDPAPSSEEVYAMDEFVPGGSRLLGTRDGGTLEETGLYIVTVFSLKNTSHPALGQYANKLKLKFAPGTSMAAGSDTVHVRADSAPYSSQIKHTDSHAFIQVFVPWRALTINAIAA